MSELKEAATRCRARSDYALFLKELVSGAVAEDEDGVRFPLGKKRCTRPLSGSIQSPMLCRTQGSNRATWSGFSERDLEACT